MEDIKQLKKKFNKRNFYTIKDSGLVYLYALIFPFLVSFIFAYVALAIAKGTGVVFPEGANQITYLFENYVGFSIPYVILTQALFLVVYLCYHKVNRISYKASTISFKKANIWTSLLAILTGIVCVFGFIWLIEGCFGKLFEVIGVTSSGLSLPLNTVGWLFVNLLVLGILPAICEEQIGRAHV